jgi:hypothetical protein
MYYSLLGKMRQWFVTEGPFYGTRTLLFMNKKEFTYKYIMLIHCFSFMLFFARLMEKWDARRHWQFIVFLLTTIVNLHFIGWYCLRKTVKIGSQCRILWNTPFSSNPAHGEVYSIQHYVIKFASYWQQVGSFFRVLQFPPPIKLTAKILLKLVLNTTTLTPVSEQILFWCLNMVITCMHNKSFGWPRIRIKLGMNSCALEGQAVPVPHVASFLLPLL